LLEKITAIKTEPLKMKCPEKDFTKALRILNPQPELLQLSAKETEVFMPVEQYTEKSLAVPVMVLNERDSVRLLPGVVELQCVVGISRYKELKPSDFRVVAVIGNEDATSTVSADARPAACLGEVCPHCTAVGRVFDCSINAAPIPFHQKLTYLPKR
jgi:hypothetical protein